MIFIGGIHGVGKTSLCKKLSEVYKLKHYSASALIAEEKSEQFEKDKRIDQIGKNQDFLLSSLKRKIKNDEHFLLDGHFCLLNKVGEITKVPLETFVTLSPLGIIVLTDSVNEIFNRLGQRDNMSYDISLLNAFQEEEVDYAEKVAYRLNIPFMVGKSSNPEVYHQYITQILRE